MALLAIAILISIAFMAALIVYYQYAVKSKELNEKNKILYMKKLQEISRLTPLQKLLKCDALLHQILKDMGYEGSLGQQLKQNPAILGNRIDAFWKVHKARNRIAHEMGEHKENELEKEADEFEKELLRLLKG